MVRLAEIRDRVLSHVNAHDVVIVEGYSYASKNQAHQLGELGGVVRLCLHEHGVQRVDVAPPTLKRFATGKGNAGKPDMLVAAIRSGYEGPSDDNCVDAWWLRQLGLFAIGEGDLDGTAYRAEVITKVDWPDAA